MKVNKFIILIVMVGLTIIDQGKAMADAGHGAADVPKATLQSIGTHMSQFLNFEPFDPPLRNHLWMKTDSDKMIFFHFAKPVSENGNKLLFTGDAVKGRFCAEDQPEGGRTGYVHFHSAVKSKDHKHGHGGEKGQEGYWLRHIALGEFEMMKIHFSPGVAHNFKATKAPSCK